MWEHLKSILDTVASLYDEDPEIRGGWILLSTAIAAVSLVGGLVGIIRKRRQHRKLKQTVLEICKPPEMLHEASSEEVRPTDSVSVIIEAPKGTSVEVHVNEPQLRLFQLEEDSA